MRIKQATYSKELKVGLPNYSNMTLSMSITVEAGEGEEINDNECWDYVNKNLAQQSGNLDPSWITTKEYKNFFKTEIKHDK